MHIESIRTNARQKALRDLESYTRQSDLSEGDFIARKIYDIYKSMRHLWGHRLVNLRDALTDQDGMEGLLREYLVVNLAAQYLSIYATAKGHDPLMRILRAVYEKEKSDLLPRNSSAGTIAKKIGEFDPPLLREITQVFNNISAGVTNLYVHAIHGLPTEDVDYLFEQKMMKDDRHMALKEQIDALFHEEALAAWEEMDTDRAIRRPDRRPADTGRDARP